jgi:hypothetical protein
VKINRIKIKRKQTCKNKKLRSGKSRIKMRKKRTTIKTEKDENNNEGE